MKIRLLMIALALLMAVPSQAQRKRKKGKARVEQPVKTAAEKLFDEMLPNTQKLIVVDSVVVDKANMLAAIPLSAGLGRIESYGDFFATPGQEGSFVYVNGFGSQCYYSELSEKRQQLFTRYKLGDQWSRPAQLEGLTLEADTLNYPYMSADGQTFYFSAKAADGLGGYDIYMTRLDADNGRFYQPENMGLPINSDANDYIYVEDETRQLAWFATDRRQPQGKVCVYTIVLPTERENYDADTMADSELRSRAKIERIRDTWNAATAPAEALESLAIARSSKRGSSKEAEQTAFVVNDELTIRSSGELKSSSAKLLYADILQKRGSLEQAKSSLEQMRADYQASNKNQKAKLAPQIREAEQSAESLADDLKQQEQKLRAMLTK